jgi:hypothetical protein
VRQREPANRLRRLDVEIAVDETGEHEASARVGVDPARPIELGPERCVGVDGIAGLDDHGRVGDCSARRIDDAPADVLALLDHDLAELDVLAIVNDDVVEPPRPKARSDDRDRHGPRPQPDLFEPTVACAHRIGRLQGSLVAIATPK